MHICGSGAPAPALSSSLRFLQQISRSGLNVVGGNQRRAALLMGGSSKWSHSELKGFGVIVLQTCRKVDELSFEAPGAVTRQRLLLQFINLSSWIAEMRFSGHGAGLWLGSMTLRVSSNPNDSMILWVLSHTLR